MKKLLLLFILFSLFSFGQETDFNFKNDGQMNLFVVTQITNKPSSEIYKKTIEWITKNYENPKEAIKAQVENDYIRIEGIEKGLFVIPLGKEKTIKEDIRYEIEIYVKDGRYKFEILSLENYDETQGWRKISELQQISNEKQLNKIKDSLSSRGINTKYYTLDRMENYTKNYSKIADYFNSLTENLKNYINGKEDAKNDF